MAASFSGKKTRNRWAKLLGLGAVAGVAATGAVVARTTRPRQDYERWQITERLHARHAEAKARLQDAEAGVWGSE